MMRIAASIISLGLTLPAWAGQLPIKNQQGAPYVSGGVSQDEQQRLKGMELRFNLKLVFTTSGGAYLTKAGVVIRNQQNDIVLQAESDGPWLYTSLPAGAYTVQAISSGRIIEQQVEVGRKGLTEAVLRW